MMPVESGSIQEMVQFDLDDEYFNRYADNIRALSLEKVSGAAKAVVHPDNLVWVVVGDREKIEAGIRELNLGEVQLMDPDGNIIN